MARRNIGRSRSKKEDTRVSEIMSLMTLANNSERQTWEYYVEKCSAFYNDMQLTADEIKSLEDANMPTFTINRITPAVEVMLFFLTAGKPRWKTVGRDMSGFDSDLGVLHTALSDYCWDISNGNQKYAKIMRDAIVKGKGVIHIHVDSNADRGNGEVLFDDIEPEELFVDPESTDIFSRDAKYMIVGKNFGKDFLKQQLPQYADKIENASGNLIGMTSLAYWQSYSSQLRKTRVSLTGSTDEEIGYYECYSKIQIPYVTFLQKIPPTDKELSEMQRQASAALSDMEREIEVKLLEVENSLNKQVEAGEILEERAILEYDKAKKSLQSQLAEMQNRVNAEIDGEIMKTVERTVPEKEYELLIEEPVIAATIVGNSEIRFYEQNILVECIAGDKLLYSTVLPYSNYPIIPIPFIHIGNPLPISAVRYVIGKQEELNKAHQIMVHHANLMSNPGLIARAGTIINKDEAQDQLTMPGGIVEYEGETPPKERIPQPINSAFYSIVESSKTDIEYSLGISSYMMGMERVTNEPFRSTLAMDEFGTRRLKAYLQSVVEPWLRHIGVVFKEIAQKTYTAHKVFRIVSSEAGNEENPMIEYEINKPIFDNVGNIVGKYFDYQSAQFDVVEVAGSVWPTSKEAREQKMFEYFTKGAIDRVAWLRSIEIEDKDGILQRTDERKQLEQTVNQLQEQIKSLRGDNDTLRRQVIQSKILVDQVQGGLSMKKEVLETRAQQKNLRNKMNSESENILNRMMSELNNLKSEIDLIKREAKLSQNKSKSGNSEVKEGK